LRFLDKIFNLRSFNYSAAVRGLQLSE
jgi:hypothetical protein